MFFIKKINRLEFISYICTEISQPPTYGFVDEWVSANGHRYM